MKQEPSRPAVVQGAVENEPLEQLPIASTGVKSAPVKSVQKLPSAFMQLPTTVAALQAPFRHI